MAATAMLVGATWQAAPAHAACPGLDSVLTPLSVRETTRPVAPLDLARLRDIGAPDSSDFASASPLAVSPDGRHLAFVLTQGDPLANTVCRGLFVVARDGREAPRRLDVGGAAILAEGAYRGLRVAVGTPVVVRPAWSPDGRQIAFLRRDHGVTQLWVASAAAGGAHPLTTGRDDVAAFRWTNNGRALIVTRPEGRDRRRAALVAEARVGFHYDDRFVPTRGPQPQPSADQAVESVVIDTATGVEQRAIDATRVGVAIPDASTRGLTQDPGALLGPMRPWARTGEGPPVTCQAAACAGAIAVFDDLDPRSVLYLRREGWARETLALYRWQRDGERSPTRLWKTLDTLLGCVNAGRELVCLAEAPRRPRRLVAVAIGSGRRRVLFDPNPEFANIALDRVVRLRWRNDRGLEARGDLVLPRGRRPLRGWPLVVTQYNSDGFLRGGTGDEYPVFAIAARGFAVLSIEQTPIVALAGPPMKSFEEVNAYNARGWAERRSLLSSLLTGVGQVVDRHRADPGRIGITGLSDGATTVAFALINTRRFAAAAISSCCIEPLSAMALGGPGYAAYMQRLGYPGIDADAHAHAFWAPMSLAQNARQVTTPLLMQLADDEYLLGLPSYAALRAAGQPVDLYVFPDEHHVKWQPAHRLAAYRRAIDWFAFWLARHEDDDPAKVEQYRHWRTLRDGRTAND